MVAKNSKDADKIKSLSEFLEQEIEQLAIDSSSNIFISGTTVKSVGH